MLKFYDSNSLFATPDLTFSNGPLVILENSSKTFYLDLGFYVSLFFFYWRIQFDSLFEEFPY